MIYLDNSATTKAFPCVIDTMKIYLQEQFYNPSSMYSPALLCEKSFSSAKQVLAKSLAVQADRVFFTSGGTEGANTAIKGVMLGNKNKHIIISATEHAAVYESALYLKELGRRTTILPVQKDGTVAIDELLAAMQEDTALVSIMHINNETGALNDISALAKAVHEYNPNCVFHSDGVQAHLKCAINLHNSGVDIYTTSAHKTHGPKGIGAMYIKKGIRLKPLMHGGGQQDNMRSGTINMPAIMGYSAAVEEYAKNAPDCKEIRNTYKQMLSSIPDVLFPAYSTNSAPHILNVAFKGVRAEVLQTALDGKGILVGKGSACKSNSTKVSYVLSAMGIDKQYADGSIRLSLGAFNTLDECETVCECIKDTVQELRKFKRR